LEVAVEFTTRAGALLSMTAVCHALASRLRCSDAFVLTGAGLLLGGAYQLLQSFAPQIVATAIAPHLSTALPPDSYLWIFLPSILFQAALSVDVRDIIPDLGPILLLAIGAVVAAAVGVGLMTHFASGESLVVCMLLGAIVSTTDPATVIELFKRCNAPPRLIRLIEGESLFNDAAAITIATVFTGALVLGPASLAHMHPLARLLISLTGGCAAGWLMGVAFVWLSSVLRSLPFSEYALSLALPNLLYPLAEKFLHVSGVAAIVCAGLAAGRLLTARRPAGHLKVFRQLWDAQAGLAGAAIFLLVTLQVPALLAEFRASDALVVGVALIAAVASRFAMLALSMPLFSRLGICKPLPAAHQLLIAWGGIRGPVTLTLALCIAHNTALPFDARQFAAATATGFVLLNLVCNGLTLRTVASWLGIGTRGAQGTQGAQTRPQHNARR
jgi:monovalent cation:H+ antiporter, CPA1 family